MEILEEAIVYFDLLEEDIATLKCLLLLIPPNERRQRRWDVHPMNEKRALEGVYGNLFPYLHQFPDKFFNFFRISEEDFEVILQFIKTRIKKRKTHRLPISEEQRLAVFLRYVLNPI